MIRNCRIWLFGVVVVVLAAGTTVMMAARAESRGEADSLLSALLIKPTRATPSGWQPTTKATDPSGAASANLTTRTDAQLAMAQPELDERRPRR